MIFVDTSAFLALVNEKDKNHNAAVGFLEDVKNGKVKIKKIMTSDYIIDETLTRIRYAVGHREAVEWGKDILASKVVEKSEVGKEIFELAWELFETYEDKKLRLSEKYITFTLILLMFLSIISSAYEINVMHRSIYIL
ncbi:MAG: PIN domain-containing protein [Candidatus Methanoperedens sp.]|nr:PIN domain-containing protein [Candidatus Methanoperedens sp.]